jgi:hypothetical protein
VGKVAISLTETQTDIDSHLNWNKCDPRCGSLAYFWALLTSGPPSSNNLETQTFPWLPLATCTSSFLLLYFTEYLTNIL